MKSVNIEGIVIVVDNSLLHPEKSINLFMDLIKFSFYFIIQNSLFVVIINLLFPKLFLFLLIIQTPVNSEGFIAFSFVFWKLYLFTYKKTFCTSGTVKSIFITDQANSKGCKYNIEQYIFEIPDICNNSLFKNSLIFKFLYFLCNILYLKAKIKLILQAKLIPYTSWRLFLDFLNFNFFSLKK